MRPRLGGAARLGREVIFQARLAWRDYRTETVTILFPLAGMILIQYLHRGVITPDPGVDINAAIEQLHEGIRSGWGEFDTYGAAAGVTLSLAVICIANVAIFTSMARERGLLRHVRTTPLSPSVFLGAQFTLTLLQSLLASAIVLGFAAWQFDVIVPVSKWPALGLIVVVASLAFSTIGVAWSRILIRPATAHAQVYIVLLAGLIVSSVLTAPQLLPADMRAIGRWLPLNPVLDAIYRTLASTAMAPTSDHLLPFSAWWAAAFVIAFPAFRWTPSEPLGWITSLRRLLRRRRTTTPA